MMGTMRFLPLLLSSGVLIVGMVPAALTAGIGQQVVLPPMLVKHLEVLTTAPTLTVEYKLRVIGDWILQFLVGRDTASLSLRETPRAYFNEFASRPAAKK